MKALRVLYLLTALVFLASLITHTIAVTILSVMLMIAFAKALTKGNRPMV